jgi:hypothetical protein
MDSLNAKRQLAASRIAQIEDRIALQRQRVERLLLQDDDASLPIRLISVLQESLPRAKEHAHISISNKGLPCIRPILVGAEPSRH